MLLEKKSFNQYQSYINAVFRSMGKEYVYHENAVAELIDFFKSGRKHKLIPDLVDIDAISMSYYMMKKTAVVFHGSGAKS